MLAQLAGLVRTRQVSARELAERALARIEEHNSALNAVVALRADEALAEARALDERLAKGDPAAATLPLCGVPALIKDATDLAGMRTTNGSRTLAEAPPAARDSVVPARLRGSGAILVGKTNVPEFCYEGYTANLVYGVTRNPWNRDLSPGGSSGGSGAAMAAGMAPIATATDGGGSIRIPASLCGLAGIKPTNGLIGRYPPASWIDFSTDGPLGYMIDDLRLLLAVEAGPVAGDPTALPDPAALPRWAPAAAWRQPGGAAPLGRPPVRILAAPRVVDWGPLPAAIADLFADALDGLERNLGYTVEHLSPAEIFSAGNLDDDWLVVATVEQAHELGATFLEEQADMLDPHFLSIMQHGLAFSAEAYATARRRRFLYIREFDELLGRDGVLVTPTMTIDGFAADGVLPGADHPGTPADAYNTQAANFTGHPALSVPAGRLPNGLPFGLQFTGPRYREDLILALGTQWEQARPWPQVAPGYDRFADL